MGCEHKAYNVGKNHCDKNTCGVRVRGMLVGHIRKRVVEQDDQETCGKRAKSGTVWWSTRNRVSKEV